MEIGSRFGCSVWFEEDEEGCWEEEEEGEEAWGGGEEGHGEEEGEDEDETFGYEGELGVG